MLRGLERERPAWAGGMLQGMRGAMPRNPSLALVRRGLIDNESRQMELLGPHGAQAGRPAAFAAGTVHPVSVTEQLAALQQQLARQQLAQSGASTASDKVQQKGIRKKRGEMSAVMPL
jgi:hypothetical protein